MQTCKHESWTDQDIWKDANPFYTQLQNLLFLVVYQNLPFK